MHYAYQACKGTQLIEFAGFVGRIRRSGDAANLLI